jgi:prepilin-type N-terminal cleavage/methylation domain-containing protein
MNRRDGFTLLEICLAVAISVLLVLIAVPSVRGVMAEQRLHATFDTFDRLVRKAQARSKSERATYALVWKKEAIELVPLDTKEGESASAESEALSRGSGEDYAIERPAALTKNPEPVWTFWRSGVCEPAIISYKGPLGTWRVKYDPLTAHGTFLTEEVK